MRVNAAAAVKRLGFTPVPHISARRIKSQEMLEEFLDGAARHRGDGERLRRRRRPGRPAGPVRGLPRRDRVRRAPAVRRQAHLHRRPPVRRPGHPRRRALVGAGAEVRRAVPAESPRHGHHPGRLRRGPGAAWVARSASTASSCRSASASPARPASSCCSASPPGSASPRPRRSRRSTACRSPTCSARRVPKTSSATCRPASTRPSTARSSCTSTPSAASRRRPSGSRTSSRSSDRSPRGTGRDRAGPRRPREPARRDGFRFC